MKVIISEKEEAGKAIAEILIPGFDTVSENKITFFKKDKTYIIPASGHIINYTIPGLRSVKKLSQLPLTIFMTKESNKDRLAIFKKYLNDADEVIIATDWDREGEVIGYNIVNYILKTPLKDMQRAYYSALRKSDIIEAFNNIKPISESLLTQGLARNIADLIIGLNLTKALSLVFKVSQTQLSQAISLGRVQSPLLGYIKKNVDLKIQNYDIETYNKVRNSYYLNYDGFQYEINLNKELIGDSLQVIDFTSENLLQSQAEDLLNTNDVMAGSKLNPTSTMEVMEQLYLKGYMTYPRTTSKYVRHVEFLKEIEDTIRKFDKNLPETFSYYNTPKHKVEEAHPDAILLTPEGIQAYYTGKFKGREEFLAKYILYSIIRSFAPPLKVKKEFIKVQYNSPEGIVEENILWNKNIENINEAIRYVSTTENPVLEVGKTYSITKILEREKEKSTSGIFRVEPRTLNDTDLVKWMTYSEIGTEATRQIFPSLLRERSYTDENNIPTLLGDIVADIVNDKVGLNPELTSTMENEINSLKKMNDLNPFLGKINSWCKEFITRLSDVQPPDFECPKGHKAFLVNRFNKFTNKMVLLLYCKSCDKYYGV